MKLFILTLLTAVFSQTSQARFQETWAYLMKGEEKYYPASSTITDVGCFSASVDGDGHLSGGHTAPPRLPGANPGTRYHLVITFPWSTTLAHIYLNPELPFRQRIINDIVNRCGPFDGVQIDIESVSAKDGTAYLNFLAAVKKAIPKNKLFSVAVMARWAEHKKKNPTDAFDYPFIGMIADRVVIMAYDEHYRGGEHGPIASLPWCKKIYDYALKTIDHDKLIMGIPLYGRGWQTPSLARSYKNSEIVDDLTAKGIKSSWDPDGASYSYTETVTVNVHYETMHSLLTKKNLYARKPIRGLAYWRIGQEPSGFWSE
jgi:spore germination protein YaaH